MLRYDTGDDHDERARGAADLNFRAAECGDKESTEYGCVDTRLRCDSGRDAEGHRKGQRDKTYGDAGDDVGHQILWPVVAQRVP